jgi:ectoine hydroxylase-related dioxygenase (phytanoyl-CoA dioxygenase family)
MYEQDSFLRAFEEDGAVVLDDVLTPDEVAVARAELEVAIEKEAQYHGGTDYPDFGMVLCAAMYGRALLGIFENEALLQPFNDVLGPGCIVYANTSSSMPPSASNFSQRIHVDCPRLIPGYLTNMGATILLDNSTEANGATWYLPGSHHDTNPPDRGRFERESRRFVAKAGAVFYFNARLWHSGGQNTTDCWRHAVTINMCRPYMKQRLDLPRLLAGVDLEGVSEVALQKLGFYAQAPASLDEYYAPPERRKFRQTYE